MTKRTKPKEPRPDMPEHKESSQYVGQFESQVSVPDRLGEEGNPSDSCDDLSEIKVESQKADIHALADHALWLEETHIINQLLAAQEAKETGSSGGKIAGKRKKTDAAEILAERQARADELWAEDSAITKMGMALKLIKEEIAADREGGIVVSDYDEKKRTRKNAVKYLANQLTHKI